MKKILLIGTLYGLLFSLFNTVYAKPYKGTDQSQYLNHFPNVVVMQCECEDSDLVFNDLLGTVRVFGLNENDAYNNALNMCRKYFANEEDKDWDLWGEGEIIVDRTECNWQRPQAGDEYRFGVYQHLVGCPYC